MATQFTYTKTPVNLDRLTNEIRASAITIALDYCNYEETTLTIYFKANLLAEDVTILDGIITAHTGEPIPYSPSPVNADGIPLTIFPIVDNYKRPEHRRIMTRPEWYFSAFALDWTTAVYNSLYNRNPDGNTWETCTDMGDGVMKFFDDTGTELVKGESESENDFNDRLTVNCVKTCIDFEKQSDHDVMGGMLYIENTPTNRAYFWAVMAPDIPREYGGSVNFLGRGMNLKMVAPQVPHFYNAESSATIYYDTTYHSGKLRLIAMHAVGEKIGLQLVLVSYGSGG